MAFPAKLLSKYALALATKNYFLRFLGEILLANILVNVVLCG